MLSLGQIWVEANLERCRPSCSPYSSPSCKYFKLFANQTRIPKIIITINIFIEVQMSYTVSSSVNVCYFPLLKQILLQCSVLSAGSGVATCPYWPCICYHHHHQSFLLSHTDQCSVYKGKSSPKKKNI